MKEDDNADDKDYFEVVEEKEEEVIEVVEEEEEEEKDNDNDNDNDNYNADDKESFLLDPSVVVFSTTAIM